MSLDVLLACAICFGNADSPLLDAARIGVLTMVGVTVCVLAGFARWFVRLARRAREHDPGLPRQSVRAKAGR